MDVIYHWVVYNEKGISSRYLGGPAYDQFPQPPQKALPPRKSSDPVEGLRFFFLGPLPVTILTTP